MPNPRANTTERAFTIVEIMIVVAIIAILMAAAIITFRSAKGATYNKDAIATGAAYAQVVAQYQADNSRRNPTTMAGAGAAEQQKGPKNLVDAYYLHGVPDSVTGGRVGVTWVNTTGCGTPSGGTQVGWVSICMGADPQYAIRVDSRPNSGVAWGSSDAKTCWIAGSGVAKSPSC